MSPEEKLEAVISMMREETINREGLDALLITAGEGLRLRTLPKGTIFAHSGLPLDRLYLLLGGSCRVLNYSRAGRRIFAGVTVRPQIFGLYELVNGIEAYTATLECADPCTILEVRTDIALTCLKNRPGAAFDALHLLALFTDDLIDRMGRLTTDSERESLLLYLYAACRGKPLPVRLSIKKDELAEFLNLNLRTLYRRLDSLEAEGLLLRRGGKIEVDAPCYARIWEEIAELVEP